MPHLLKLVTSAAILTSAAVTAAYASSGQVISNNLPGFARATVPMGRTDVKKTIEVTVWLKPRNKAGFDRLVASLYDPASPNYRRWITPVKFAADYAPSAADAASVSQFLRSSGLSVLSTGPHNMYVRAQGTVAKVNSAFQVELHDFQFKGQTLYANTSEPIVAGAAGKLISAVYGLHNLGYTHPNVTRTAPSGGGGAQDSSRTALASAPGISADCIGSSVTESFSTGGVTYPDVTLTGNLYAPNAGPLGGCGYTPPEIQKAYNLSTLYKKGYDGSGQTIVIIDWCGSPTILADANAFSAAYGLPALTAANFQIVNSSSPPACSAPDPEINIDVEWAHAIAPGAKITLVVPPSASFADVDTGEFFAVINGLGGVISGSYGSEEYYDAPAELATESLINEIAAAQGIAANFSSGDDGDFTFDIPQDFPASVSAPADSPYATAVGGISLALKSNGAIAWQSGWGTNLTVIDEAGLIDDPPYNIGFYFGAGGGPSAVFAKPAYQSALKGPARLLPDVSWLADPYTGGVIVISEPFQYPEQTYQVYGGTSLACPMFSALWAIANQVAGVALGQAAPYLYSLPATAILDVTPVASATNVTATYQESATKTDTYTSAELAAPLESTAKFLSAIWNYPLNQDTVFIVTFGTDSGLKTTPGWDDVTGVGVPNGPAFVEAFAKK
jgi:subtilase family serine protease